ncbi:MAG: PCRF domain-containing protein, partial [Bilophila sp.]
MFAKLESLERKYLELEQELAEPGIFNDQERYRKLTKAHSDLEPVVDIFRLYRTAQQTLVDNKELANDADPEIREMAQEEIKANEERIPELEHDLKVLLLPTDPLDEKNILLEIRAGTGGEEAALFAADLFRMYCRYAEKMGWKVEIMSESDSDTGGYKEIIALIAGDKVYSRLKFESGTHRVQRVPATESQGRIHTSAATVAVMPEAEELDFDIKPEELR